MALSSAPRETTVVIDGKYYTIKIRQKSKSVWVAYGTFGDVFFDTKGSSEAIAIKTWQAHANYLASK
jgi:hypothetical protein